MAHPCSGPFQAAGPKQSADPAGGAPSLEFELLLQCARFGLDTLDPDRVEYLCRCNPDWDRIFQLSLQHRILPLVHRSLAGIRSNVIPEDIRSRFRRHDMANGARNLRLNEELFHILAALGTKGIKAVPFKGPVLAETAYNDVTLRQFDDIEILIRRSDLARTIRLLGRRGYSLLKPPVRGDRAPVSGRQYAFTLCHQQREVILDLHWNFSSKTLPRGFDLETFLMRTQPVNLGQMKVDRFCPEDLLILLTLHGAKHLWSRLVWICDVARLMRRFDGTVLPRALALARGLGCERTLELAWMLACDLCAVEQTVLDRERESAAKETVQLADSVKKRLFSGSNGRNSWREVRDRNLFHYRLRERRGDRLHYLLIKVKDLLDNHPAFLYNHVKERDCHGVPLRRPRRSASDDVRDADAHLFVDNDTRSIE